MISRNSNCNNINKILQARKIFRTTINKYKAENTALKYTRSLLLGTIKQNEEDKKIADSKIANLMEQLIEKDRKLITMTKSRNANEKKILILEKNEKEGNRILKIIDTTNTKKLTNLQTLLSEKTNEYEELSKKYEELSKECEELNKEISYAAGMVFSLLKKSKH